VKTQETILIAVLALLLSAAGASAQTQLSREKKEELRKFGPEDIVPETREGEPKERERPVGGQVVGGAQSRRNDGTSAAPAPILATEGSRSGATSSASTSKAGSSLATSPSLRPESEVVPTQPTTAKKSPQEPERVATANIKRSTRSTRLSLPLIFFLLSLILLALGGIAIKLKNDLRGL
jgi:hypothetical protein